jgi:hypothetical protein
MTPLVQVCKAMQSLKRFTARECNRILHLTGQPFWQDESYDRLVRDLTEFERIVRYIEMNPVNAGLAPAPEDFRWSSAGADLQSAAGFQPAPQRASATITGLKLQASALISGQNSTPFDIFSRRRLPEKNRTKPIVRLAPKNQRPSHRERNPCRTARQNSTQFYTSRRFWVFRRMSGVPAPW